ncbi:hypothetical protein GCM10009733_007150 [Nonomuraea maheshkhaliensis]|uniref:Uncharacterized protein n=1 Tax=Nonomuraea maheshkhaliensis TaxID=419590 RepID=A0ABN2EPF0_9ACTN
MGRRVAERPRQRQALQELHATARSSPAKAYASNRATSRIDMSDLERNLLQASSGVRILDWDQWPTGAPYLLLTSSGACGDHPNRPTACRLYGAVATANMRCPHGCTASTTLSAEQLVDVILRSFTIGGHRDYAAHADTTRTLVADPRLGPPYCGCGAVTPRPATRSSALSAITSPPMTTSPATDEGQRTNLIPEMITNTAPPSNRTPPGEPRADVRVTRNH